MRHSTVPIIAAVALSLTFPSSADARPRFGPAALLGAVAGFALLGGFRHSSRHHRHSATHPSLHQRSARAARMERRAALSAHRPSTRPPAEPPTTPPSERTAPVAPEQGATVPPDQTAALPPERMAPTPGEQTAAIFWPDAARDLVEYVLLPRGNGRFWAHGYDAIVQAAFAPSNVDDRGARSRPDGNQVSDAASPPTAPFSSSDRCGNVAADAGADALIERLERVVEPSASQREALEQLRTAVAQVIERINATTCPGAAPATFAQRLTAIQDRIWAMHDALLTLRLPFETFNNALTDDQQRRLRGGAPGSAPSEANATDGRAQTCADPAAGTADGIMRAIERAADRPGSNGRGWTRCG